MINVECFIEGIPTSCCSNPFECFTKDVMIVALLFLLFSIGYVVVRWLYDRQRP